MVMDIDYNWLRTSSSSDKGRPDYAWATIWFLIRGVEEHRKKAKTAR